MYMRRVLLYLVLAVVLALIATPAQAKQCRSGDPAITRLEGHPMPCPGVRHVAQRWQETRRCRLVYDARTHTCRLRVQGWRWVCSWRWIDSGKALAKVYGVHRVNCWVPRLPRPYERWVNFLAID